MLNYVWIWEEKPGGFLWKFTPKVQRRLKRSSLLIPFGQTHFLHLFVFFLFFFCTPKKKRKTNTHTHRTLSKARNPWLPGAQLKLILFLALMKFNSIQEWSSTSGIGIAPHYLFGRRLRWKMDCTVFDFNNWHCSAQYQSVFAPLNNDYSQHKHNFFSDDHIVFLTVLILINRGIRSKNPSYGKFMKALSNNSIYILGI